MDKKAGVLRRNLSLFTFIAVYLIIALALIFLESFQWETQWNVITTLVPFFIIGLILDFIVSRNHDLQNGYLIFAQLLPVGVFLLFGISIMLSIIDKPPVDAYNYIIWLFVALPFFITSNFRENYRKRMLSSLIGTGLFGAVYIQLTTITDELNEESGLIVYLICIFLVFYAASGLKKIFFIGLILGLIDAIILIFLWKNPITAASKLYGWDYDIAFKFELLLLANIIICILICLIAVLIEGKNKN
jgi:hypothetical protein